MKKRYCKKCGKKMLSINAEGQKIVYFYGGSLMEFSKRHNPKTGKETQLFTCPDWNYEEHTFRWFEFVLGNSSTEYYANGHDRYLEGEEDD